MGTFKKGTLKANMLGIITNKTYSEVQLEIGLRLVDPTVSQKRTPCALALHDKHQLIFNCNKTENFLKKYF